MKRQNKTNQNKEKKKEQKTKKLVQASVKGRTITVHIEMEKRTGKVALEIKNGHFTFWKNVHFLFVSHRYRFSRHLASSGPAKYIWKTLFFSIILSNTPEGVDWVSFVSLKMFCSPIHNLDLRVLASVFVSSLRQFFATFCPTLGVLNIYRVLNNTSNAKNTQYSVAFKLHFIMPHYTFIQCLESSKMLRIEGCQWRCQGKFKPSIVISLLSLLFPLTFGKSILISSVAPFKGLGFRNPANFGIRNPDCSTACNPKSKNVLHILTLGQVQPSCCVGCPVLVLELKSFMLCPSCDVEISPVRQDYHCFQCCDYTISKGI